MKRVNSMNALDDPMENSSKVEKIKADSTVSLGRSMKDLLTLRATLLGEMGQSGEVFAFRRTDFERVVAEMMAECDYSEESGRIVNLFLSKMTSIRQHY